VAKKAGKWTTEKIEDDNFSNLHRNSSFKKLMNNFPIEKNPFEKQEEILSTKSSQNTQSNEIESKS
jgi:hypothetical protein